MHDSRPGQGEGSAALSIRKGRKKKRTNKNRMKKSTEINEVTSTKIHVITSW